MLKKIIENINESAKSEVTNALGELRKQNLAPETIMDITGVDDVNSFRTELTKWVNELEEDGDENLEYFQILLDNYKQAWKTLKSGR